MVEDIGSVEADSEALALTYRYSFGNRHIYVPSPDIGQRVQPKVTSLAGRRMHQYEIACIGIFDSI